jgi:hypothetical protein
MAYSGSFESGIVDKALCLGFPRVVNVSGPTLSLDQKDVMISLISYGNDVRVNASMITLSSPHFLTSHTNNSVALRKGIHCRNGRTPRQAAQGNRSRRQSVGHGHDYRRSAEHVSGNAHPI